MPRFEQQDLPLMFSHDLLKGKRILVTGGGTGLGKEISLGFAAHGAHVFICGRRPEILEQAILHLPILGPVDEDEVGGFQERAMGLEVGRVGKVR